MSDPAAKTARSKAKDARQMPAPDRKPKHKTKKAKPWRVEYRWCAYSQFGWSREWSKFGAYRAKEEAETAIRNDERKNGWYEYRIVKMK